MKWFFALNEDGAQFENYAKMVRVAVHTAARHTTLQPYFLYDGTENELTAWLRARDVPIIKCRTVLYDILAKCAAEKGDPNILAIGAGAFLRTEIPRIMLEMDFADPYVLYTDVDVMFRGDVSALDAMRPAYFAVAPEVKRRNYKRMNSGVMLMNIKALGGDGVEFEQFTRANIDALIADAWDQTAYKMFYAKRFFGYRWDRLAPDYNWKPYWPPNDDARIVHFHGPKPYQRQDLTSGDTPAHLKPLLPLVTDNYLRLSDEWLAIYAEIEDEL